MKCKITPDNITELKENEVFVFGSNLAGIHGAGAAILAKKFGAKLGMGSGLTGSCYALPTKGLHLEKLTVEQIKMHVSYLKNCILANPDKHFLITKVGCGLAGNSIETIAPLFKDFINIENCSLPQEFIDE